MRRSWRPNRTATYWPPLLWPSASLSRSPAPCHLFRILSPTGLVFKLTDFLSSPSYIIVQSPTQYLPITSHRDLSLPLSLEWHVWLSSSGNNCHAVHRSLYSGASVYDCTAGFYLVPFCQPCSPTSMEYALPPSLEWHVWPGRRSVYNITKYIWLWVYTIFRSAYDLSPILNILYLLNIANFMIYIIKFAMFNK